MSPERIPYRALGYLAGLTTFGIVYGSLLPFEYRPTPLDFAIEYFKHPSWIDVGEGGRADMVANLVLYLPFGFFAGSVLTRRMLFVGALLTIGLGVALAVGVEFAQFWAAPRTVSLNDIVTEISGTIIGLVVWTLWGKALVQAAQATIAGGRQALQATLGLYILAYAVVSLFPFDFLVSVREIAARLDEPNVIVWTSHDFFSLRGLLGLFVRIAAMIPFGAVAKLVWRRSIVTAVVVAMYFATVIEILHWFEVSYSLSFSNIVFAGLGAAIGHRFAEFLVAGGLGLRVGPWAQSGTLLFAFVYLLALPIVRGWRFSFAGLSQIEQTIALMNWWPFYYHYYVPEGTALASTVAVTVSFMPVGMLRWAMQLRTRHMAARSNPVWPSAVAAAVLCAVLEIGVLFTANLRPDPTNMLIAVVAAMLGQRTCEWVARIAEEMGRPGRRVR